MVARALLLKPKIIIADEPVSMVDASLRATILGSLRRLTDELGISILYITHDLATAWQVSDNIIVMYRAAAVEAGQAEAIVKNSGASLYAAAGGIDPPGQPDARLAVR